MSDLEKKSITSESTMLETIDEPKQSFWRIFCKGKSENGGCCKTVLNRFKSIFERRPSSLHPLDGLRAIAIIWVLLIHSALFVSEKYLACL